MSLVALLITMLCVAAVLAGIAQFIIATTRGYSSIKQMTGMENTAQNVMDMIGNMIREAGSDLPAAGIVIAANAAGDSLAIKVNPHGAYYVATKTDTGRVLYVAGAKAFINLSRIYCMRNTMPPSLDSASIDYAYSTGDTGFIHGVDSTHDSIRLTATDTLCKGEALFAQEIYVFRLDRSTGIVNLSVNNETQVLAENIDSLKTRFFDFSGNPKTQWQEMQLCSLKVVAYGAYDPKYMVYPDHRRRFALSRGILLRNNL